MTKNILFALVTVLGLMARLPSSSADALLPIGNSCQESLPGLKKALDEAFKRAEPTLNRYANPGEYQSPKPLDSIPNLYNLETFLKNYLRMGRECQDVDAVVNTVKILNRVQPPNGVRIEDGASYHYWKSTLTYLPPQPINTKEVVKCDDQSTQPGSPDHPVLCRAESLLGTTHFLALISATLAAVSELPLKDQARTEIKEFLYEKKYPKLLYENFIRLIFLPPSKHVKNVVDSEVSFASFWRKPQNGIRYNHQDYVRQLKVTKMGDSFCPSTSPEYCTILMDWTVFMGMAVFDALTAARNGTIGMGFKLPDGKTVFKDALLAHGNEINDLVSSRLSIDAANGHIHYDRDHSWGAHPVNWYSNCTKKTANDFKDLMSGNQNGFNGETIICPRQEGSFQTVERDLGHFQMFVPYLNALKKYFKDGEKILVGLSAEDFEKKLAKTLYELTSTVDGADIDHGPDVRGQRTLRFFPNTLDGSARWISLSHPQRKDFLAPKMVSKFIASGGYALLETEGGPLHRTLVDVAERCYLKEPSDVDYRSCEYYLWSNWERKTASRSLMELSFFSSLYSSPFCNTPPDAVTKKGDTIKIESKVNECSLVSLCIDPLAWRDKAVSKGKSGIDLMILMDTTGSMGEEINQITKNIQTIADNLKAVSPSLRVGVAQYRDFSGYGGDSGDFPIKPVVNLTNDFAEVAGGLSSLRASGGGDAPESLATAVKAVADGLGLDGYFEAHNYGWSDSKEGRAKVILAITDAPNNNLKPSNAATMEDAAKALKDQGILFLGIARSDPAGTATYKTIQSNSNHGQVTHFTSSGSDSFTDLSFLARASGALVHAPGLDLDGDAKTSTYGEIPAGEPAVLRMDGFGDIYGFSKKDSASQSFARAISDLVGQSIANFIYVLDLEAGGRTFTSTRNNLLVSGDSTSDACYADLTINELSTSTLTCQPNSESTIKVREGNSGEYVDSVLLKPTVINFDCSVP